MSMRSDEKELNQEEKTDILCSGFSLLDEVNQENMLGTLQALLFAKMNMETVKETPYTE